jgi:hypothetical protein
MEEPPPLMEAPPIDDYMSSFDAPGSSAAPDSPPPAQTESSSNRPNSNGPSASDAPASAAFPELPCPKCGQGQIVEGKKGFGCNRYREGCKFVVWKEVAKKTLTHEQVTMLITKGKTGVIKGFTSRKGSTFETKLKLDDEWKTVFDFN